MLSLLAGKHSMTMVPASCKTCRHNLMEAQQLHTPKPSMLILIERSLTVISAPDEPDMPDLSNRDNTAADGCAL